MAGTTQIGSGNNLSVTYTAATTVYAQSINPDNGCKSAIVPIVLTVNPLPTSTAPDVPVCVGSTLVLGGTAAAGTAPYSYSWTQTLPVGSTFTSIDQNPTVTATAATTDAGTYLFFVTDSKGCTASDPAVVTVNPIPATPTATITQPTCTVATGTITVTSPVPAAGLTYTLTGINPVVAPVTNATGVFPGLAPGDYTVTASANGCTSAPLTQTITAPAVCCMITDEVLVVGVCNNSSTNGDPADDTYTFTLNPIGTDLGLNYTVSGITATVQGAGNANGSYAYGAATIFGPFLIMDGVQTITITDSATGTCQITGIMVAPPTACSVCPTCPVFPK